MPRRFRARRRRRGKKVGKVAKKVRSYVKKAISRRLEDKFIQEDAPPANPISSTTGVGYCLSSTTQTVQGTGSNNRVGDKIRMKNLEIRLHMAGTSATYDTAFRIFLIRFKDPQGVNLAVSDFMVNNAGVGIDRPVYPKPLLDRVDIMMDRVYTIKALGNVTADVAHRLVTIRKRLDMVQTFLRNTTSTTGTAIEKNSIWLWIVGMADSAGVASRTQLVDLQWSLTYEDA